MPKEFVVTRIDNRIEWATTNGKGIIVGKSQDVTDESISAVYAHLKAEFNRRKDVKKNFGYKFKDGGRLYYEPPKKGE